MLDLLIPAFEMYNEANEEFISMPDVSLRLEHSLVSVSKWESEWKKPFLSVSEKTRDETISYIKCMTITQNVNPLAYMGIGFDEIVKVNKYIEDDHTATTFAKDALKTNKMVTVTSEQIYYWMTLYGIPFECQKWHLGRLLTLIKIASIENSPKKKMSKRAILERNAALNKARRKAMNSRG